MQTYMRNYEFRDESMEGKGMFSNPGSKIKKVSVVLFWFTICASVILALVFGIDTHYSWGREYSTVNWAVILLCLVVVPVVSYITTIFLVGFGELVENSKKDTPASGNADPAAGNETEQAN